MKLFAVLSFSVLISGCAGYSAHVDLSGESATAADLVKAAKEEVRISDEEKSQETACSIFVLKVLKRSGIEMKPFTANGFSDFVETVLPDWIREEFSIHDASRGREALRYYLNEAHDGSAFIAQWPREGRSGHIAIIEKVAHDKFIIYQAQSGRATAHSKETSVESLLYAKNQWGERAKLRLYHEPAKETGPLAEAPKSESDVKP